MKTYLPKILVIDDQFGRCGLGKTFRKDAGESFFSGYRADRENLCRIYGLLDISGDSKPIPEAEAQAEAVFCSAQRWDKENRSVENDLAYAIETVRRGWTFKDGTRWALVLLDLRFTTGALDTFGSPAEGSLFGLEVILPALRREFGEDLPVVVLSSTDRNETNEKARRAGALDFIQRVPGAGAPPDAGREALKRMLLTHALLPDGTGMVVGCAIETLKMLRLARRSAMSGASRNILLLGETGTGKNLLAKFIHNLSGRRNSPFVEYHAAAGADELQASDLFGHSKGAFTGAVGESVGKWVQADGGTLFIDEAGNLTVADQRRLMRAIEERKVQRLGDGKETAVDVSVILATNRDLKALVASGEVLDDFLNRINEFEIMVPPLRERREDIPLLAEALASQIRDKGVWTGKITAAAMAVLKARDWREGNVRELRSVLQRACTNNPWQDLTETDVAEQGCGAGLSECQPDEQTRTSALHSDMQKEVENPPQLHPSISSALPDVGTLTLAEIQAIKKERAGFFGEYIAESLGFALRLTQKSGGELNPTAAVRFLLGDETLTTTQAKQFLKRVLGSDTTGFGVNAAFAKTGLGAEHSLLACVLAETARPRRASSKSQEETTNERE